MVVAEVRIVVDDVSSRAAHELGGGALEEDKGGAVDVPSLNPVLRCDVTTTPPPVTGLITRVDDNDVFFEFTGDEDVREACGRSFIVCRLGAVTSTDDSFGPPRSCSSFVESILLLLL